MNKDFKVKDVQRFVGSYPLDSIHAIQQVLEWFGVNRKFERIVWSMIRRREVQHVKEVDAGKRRYAKYKKLKDEGKPYHPPLDEVGTVPDISLVIGKCPRCDNNLLGMPTRACKKGVNGKFGGLVFYKECASCTYYSEVFKKRNKYVEIEGD